MSFISFRSTTVFGRIFSFLFGIKKDTPSSPSRIVELPPNTVITLRNVKYKGQRIDRLSASALMASDLHAAALMEQGVPIAKIGDLVEARQVANSAQGWRTISPKAFKESTDAFVEGHVDASPGLNIDIAPRQFTLSRNETDILYRFVDEWGRCKITFAKLLRQYDNDISNADVRYAANALNTSRDAFNALLAKIAFRHPKDSETVIHVSTITALARAWIAWRTRSAEPDFNGTKFSENAARLEFRRYLKKFHIDL
jgi:hypothetical protein